MNTSFNAEENASTLQAWKNVVLGGDVSVLSLVLSRGSRKDATFHYGSFRTKRMFFIQDCLLRISQTQMIIIRINQNIVNENSKLY